MIPTSRTLVFALVAIGALAAAGWLLLPARGVGEVRFPAPAAWQPAPNMPKGTPVGITGCLSAACHGGPATASLTGKFDANSWQSSGTCWAARDPHVKAFEVLTQPLAREIMAKFNPGVRATEDSRCLACHTNPALAADSQNAELRREGVSCEACHGNAGGWLRDHTIPGSRTSNVSRGMTALSDVGDRAMTCLGCHVGGPADPERGYPVRDMNHDMIAAGHPRLNFDFAEYHRRMPKHWLEEPASPEREARVWLIGRIAHAEAACRLLADRAERAEKDDPRTTWPEFAEYNCAACHHTIPQEWRGEGKRLGTRPPGSLEWQTIWPLTGTPAMPSEVEELRKLQAVMQGSRPAGFAKLIGPAHTAAEKLNEFGSMRAGLPDAELLKTAKRAFPLAPPEQLEWDLAGQLLLGLAAMERGRKPEPQTVAEFDRVFDAVRRRSWSEARPSLGELLGRLKR